MRFINNFFSYPFLIWPFKIPSKAFFIFFWIVILIHGGFAENVSLEDLHEEESVEPPPTQEKIMQELVRRNNLFALKLYHSFHADTQENIAFSPYNISAAMMLPYLGAQEETKTEIGEVFQFEDQIELEKNFALFNRQLTQRYSNTPDDFGIFVANSIWLANRLSILPSYTQTLSQYARGIFRRVNFTQKEAARAEINTWVRENTHGKIKEILSPYELTPETQMVLVSSLYLKAKWEKVFNKEITRLEPFFSLDKDLIIPLMNTVSTFPYYQDDNVAILEMPYVQPNPSLPKLSLLIFLPHERDGLPDFEKRLILDRVEYWIPSLKVEKVAVRIPRFNLNFALSLNTVLKKMGMSSAFQDNANFSGITGLKNLKIGNVLHKTSVTVDEYGTEAATATAISMQPTASYDASVPKIFRADHPFLFMIIEKDSGAILFMGRVINPKM